MYYIFLWNVSHIIFVIKFQDRYYLCMFHHKCIDIFPNSIRMHSWELFKAVPVICMLLFRLSLCNKLLVEEGSWHLCTSLVMQKLYRSSVVTLVFGILPRYYCNFIDTEVTIYYVESSGNVLLMFHISAPT